VALRHCILDRCGCCTRSRLRDRPTLRPGTSLRSSCHGSQDRWHTPSSAWTTSVRGGHAKRDRRQQRSPADSGVAVGTVWIAGRHPYDPRRVRCAWQGREEAVERSTAGGTNDADSDGAL
jgi:hypothetical protein